MLLTCHEATQCSQATRCSSMDLFAVANEKASAEDLVNVTRQIEAFWEKIALLLEPRMFDGGRITVIKKEHDSEFTRANAMLQQWSDKFDSEATRRQLIVAMCKAELVAQVRTVFGQELVDDVQHQLEPRMLKLLNAQLHYLYKESYRVLSFLFFRAPARRHNGENMAQESS